MSTPNVVVYAIVGCAAIFSAYLMRKRVDELRKLQEAARKNTTTQAAALEKIDWETEKEIQVDSSYADVRADGASNGRVRRGLTFDATGQPILIVGVCGGSGSGKTTLSRSIIENYGAHRVTYISHDYYYKDLSNLTLEQRHAHNFDHPNALDTSLMVKDLAALRRGESVNIPQYDFATHTRRRETTPTVPNNVILVEGILIFTDPKLVDLMDIKIYVDTPDDIRFIRRLKRDMHERDRTADSVMTQYLRTVRPMHMTFVEPSKRVADILVPQGVNSVALDMIISRLNSFADEIKDY